MNYLVAVSGGVDSVVLLDMLVHYSRRNQTNLHHAHSRRQKLRASSLQSAELAPSYRLWLKQSSTGQEVVPNFSGFIQNATDLSDFASDLLIVAHFEHGIRGEESLGDQKFVENLAERYGLKFITTNAALGAGASEAEARAARYEFLRREAKKHDARIVTAHHADDVIETIAINLERGTGWRGLAALDSQIVRPLLAMTKQEILEYAQEHNLEWREDSTNHSDAYLRNRVRQKLVNLDNNTKRQLLALRAAQTELKRVIDAETAQVLSDGGSESRYFFTMIDDRVADELLRQLCVEAVGVAPARPARAQMLHAIKTARVGAVHQSTDGFWLSFTKREFHIHNDQPRVA